LLLPERGELRLVSDRETIELDDSDKLYLKWIDNGESFSTGAVIGEHSRSRVDTVYKSVVDSVFSIVTVNILEVNRDRIRIGSPYWKKLEHLPALYFKEGNAIEIIQEPRPTVFIPLDKLQYIYRYERKPTWRDFWRAHYHMFTGAFAGAALFVWWYAADLKEDDKEGGGTGWDYAGDFLLFTAVGAAAGAVISPVYHLLDIWIGGKRDSDILQYSRVYPVNQEKYGYRLQVVPMD